MKNKLRLAGFVVWAIGFALIIYLLILNNVVPYNQIDQRSFSSTETVGIALIASGVLLVFIHNAKTKQKPP
jgi:mannose/fructose/N-acetylgalactosamine-specific phosphotransferase system component IIC